MLQNIVTWFGVKYSSFKLVCSVNSYCTRFSIKQIFGIEKFKKAQYLLGILKS